MKKKNKHELIVTWALTTKMATMMILVMAPQSDALTQVTGNVFCDVCLDGSRGFLDYGESGATVALECPGEDKPIKYAQTDNVGDFTMLLKGGPNLRACTVRIITAYKASLCSVVATGRGHMRRTFHLWFYHQYSVDDGQLYVRPPPGQPMLFCKKRHPPPTAYTLANGTTDAHTTCTPEFWLANLCQWRHVAPDWPVDLAFGTAAVEALGVVGGGGGATFLDALLRGTATSDVSESEPKAFMLAQATAAMLNLLASKEHTYPDLNELISRCNAAVASSSLDDSRTFGIHLRNHNQAQSCIVPACPLAHAA